MKQNIQTIGAAQGGGNTPKSTHEDKANSQRDTTLSLMVKRNVETIRTTQERGATKKT